MRKSGSVVTFYMLNLGKGHMMLDKLPVVLTVSLSKEDSNATNHQ